MHDSRGTGLSDRNVTDVSLDAQVNDLEAVVDAAGLDQFPLLGISAGVYIAIAFAARHPQRVTRLVLQGATSRGATQEQMADWNELQRLSVSSETAARHKLAIDEWDVTSLLPQIKCPTMVVHCRDDARVPYAEGRLLASQIPNARLVTLEGKNHVLMKGDPAFDAFFAALREFVPPGKLPAKQQADTPFADLSRREREVLELVAQGLDNLQISAHLGVAEKTVRNIMTNIFDKIAVENRPQAIVRAREAGFGATHH
jgi:pimeloyl-ACP methyl ester carboxylesterase/DNA-binding CsgD family transcriptional regulator